MILEKKEGHWYTNDKTSRQMPIAYSRDVSTKMPTPIWCELADNLSGETFFWHFSEVYKKAVIAPKLVS